MAFTGLSAGAGNAIAGGLGALASIGSSFMAASMGSKGQYRSYKYNRKLQQQQYDLQQRGYLEGPTNARQGYERAGINPILAMSDGSSGYAGVGSGGSVGSPSYPNVDVGSGITNAFKTLQLERKKNTAEINNLDSSTKSNNAEAEYKSQLTQNEQVKHGIYELQKIEQQYQNDMKKFDRDTQEYRFAQEMSEMASRTKLNLETAMFTGYNAISNRIVADARSKDADTNAKNLKLEQDKFDGSQDKFMMEYAKNHPVLYGAYRHLDNAAGLAGRVLGGAGSLAVGAAALNNSSTNAKNLYTETAKFDRNGSYIGHSRTEQKRIARKILRRH